MLSLRGKWNVKVTKGTKLQSKDTHLPPALYRRVLHGDRCASETLQGVHISRASWIAAWNVRATYLAIISMKKKKKKEKKASGCVSYKTDTNWRGTRWQGIWLLEWYFSQWRILNRFRSLLEIFSDFFYHIWLNIFFPRLLLLAKRAVVSSIQEQSNEGKWKNWVKINKLF